jgi:hypothetical protein
MTTPVAAVPGDWFEYQVGQVLEYFAALFGDAAQVCGHLGEKWLFAEEVLDEPGHVGVYRLVIGDSVAQSVGQRHRA